MVALFVEKLVISQKWRSCMTWAEIHFPTLTNAKCTFNRSLCLDSNRKKEDTLLRYFQVSPPPPHKKRKSGKTFFIANSTHNTPESLSFRHLLLRAEAAEKIFKWSKQFFFRDFCLCSTVVWELRIVIGFQKIGFSECVCSQFHILNVHNHTLDDDSENVRARSVESFPA